jgi:glycosyltransferase involved in cell wall biosynthesis
LPDSGLHFLTPEYPPANGGVADYTRLLAAALAKQLGTVHVWAPRLTGPEAVDDGIVVHRVAGFDRCALEEIGAQLEALPGPRRLFLQYVPTSFGFRGMNVPLVRWLRMRPEKLWVQFHEVALGWKLWRKPHLHLMHAVQLWMAAALSRRADRIFVSIEAWKQRLGGHARRAVWLPIPSNIPEHVEAADVEHARRSLGGAPVIAHFGTYSPLIVTDLAPAIREIGRLRPDTRFLLLGRGALEFSRTLGLAGRVDVKENLPATEIAALLKASALVLQPFPDGISARRTSAMAGLALGVPMVTTDGFLTDQVWREGAVALGPVGEPLELARLSGSLLDDPERSRGLGERGARLYRERFSLERTLETLASLPDAKVPSVP